MFRVLLITAQCTNGSKAHDQYQVPAAGVVQNIASNFQVFDARNAGWQGQHSFAEFCDMFIAGACFVPNQNVVLQHSLPDFGACRDDGGGGIEFFSRKACCSFITQHEFVTFGPGNDIVDVIEYSAAAIVEEIQ